MSADPHPLPLPLPLLQKHVRYGNAYKPNEVYWGIGIENETYLQLDADKRVPASFLKNRKRERYSVDYWNTYKEGVVEKTFTHWIQSLPFKETTPLELPVLINAHTLTKTDRYGHSKTTYAVHPEPNPLFCGTTLLEDLCTVDPEVFQDGRDVWWCFDGDTIEFMTQEYYCTSVEDCVDELRTNKQRWIEAFREGLLNLHGREIVLVDGIGYPDKNRGLAVFLTNRNHISPFNNGTYHINLTLPTRLNAEARICDGDLFLRQHRCLARMFQWISPFLVGRFGSPDILGTIPGCESLFPRGSQRLCTCRYVGVGTFDTDKMARGKLLTLPYEHMEWYEIVYGSPSCSYERLPALGVDINFQKHWNHGLEFRIFDWFPEACLPDLLRLLVWLADESLTRMDFPNPQQDPLWNQVLARCVWEGGETLLSPVEASRFRDVLCIPELSAGSVSSAYTTLWSHLCSKWNHSTDSCTSRMTRDPLVPATQTYCLPFSETMDSLVSASLPAVTEESNATAVSTTEAAADPVPVVEVVVSATPVATSASDAPLAPSASDAPLAPLAPLAPPASDAPLAPPASDASPVSVLVTITTEETAPSPAPVVPRSKIWCCY